MKKLAITMGDPGGVGPEIILKALSSAEIYKHCMPFVIGSRTVMAEALESLRLSAQLHVIKSPAECAPSAGTINLVDMDEIEDFTKGRPTSEGGRACVAYIRKAIALAMNKEADGIVTAPISKEALKMAGVSWPGHTEMLAELTGTDNYAMVLAGGPLRVILTTIHTSIKSVSDMISMQRVLSTIRLAKKACGMMGIENPVIAVAGLNPHAGEAGMFGEEEESEIIPAIEEARREGIQVSGPFPPDTIFHSAYKGEIDIVVCMYHDQGLIPLKMIAFDTGVNITIGLPIIRTSPDHGTAYDIAWQGKATPSSMIEAIKMASRLNLETS